MRSRSGGNANCQSGVLALCRAMAQAQPRQAAGLIAPIRKTDFTLSYGNL
jgi:hypothetical protein